MNNHQTTSFKTNIYSKQIAIFGSGEWGRGARPRGRDNHYAWTFEKSQRPI